MNRITMKCEGYAHKTQAGKGDRRRKTDNSHQKTPMLPPVLEIYVVWHPSDVKAAEVAGEFVEHFSGTIFTGLIRGAVEIFVRSEGWRHGNDAPRPIPCPDAPFPKRRYCNGKERWKARHWGDFISPFLTTEVGSYMFLIVSSPSLARNRVMHTTACV